jgi:SAM-dependent methyltransferase
LSATVDPRDLDAWLFAHLVCPRCHRPLGRAERRLTCASGHAYHLTPDGIPVLVLDDVDQTHWAATSSLEHAAEAVDHADAPDGIDPQVHEAVSATCGNLYAHLVGRVPRYPIPAMPVEAPAGSIFLDIGCNWGRWCVSAARKGWRVVGVDPYLPSIRAARRIARACGVSAAFVVGDARYLPFADSFFDLVHSYSVLQHFSEADVAATAAECGRVLKAGGRAHIQMAQKFGLRNIVQQMRRGFRPPAAFEVRYWPGAALRDVFQTNVGTTTLDVDGFFSLNAQSADLDLLKPHHRLVVHTSNAFRRASTWFPPLVRFADSVYVRSVKTPVVC